MSKYTQAEKIMAMVFPTEMARRFLCDDFYQELLKVIPPQKCICQFNIIKRVRLNNLALVKKTIVEFLANNNDYVYALKDIYFCDNLDNIIINRLILGFVYFISKTNKEFKDINITTDRYSICYYDVDMLNLLTGK